MVKINLDYLIGTDSVNQPLAKPGEIWQVTQTPLSPLEFSEAEKVQLYTKTAQDFLNGKSVYPYVLILEEPKFPAPDEEDWQIVLVMVLSPEIEQVSDVNLVIPTSISGFHQSLLAETWHTLPMLSCNLQDKPIGKVSQEITELLIGLSNYPEQTTEEAQLLTQIKSSGIIIGEPRQNSEAFEQQERDWADVLTIPFKAYWKYYRSLKFTENLLNEAASINQEITDFETKSVTPVNWFGKTWKDLRQFSSEHPNSQSLCSLREISNNNHNYSVPPVRFKEITLGNLKLILRTIVDEVSENKCAISIQVCPALGEHYLPRHLNIKLLSASKQMLKNIQARQKDNYIQIPKFKSSKGTAFFLEISLGEHIYQERFEI